MKKSMKINIIILFALLICNSSKAQTAQQSNVLDNFNHVTEQVFDTYKIVNTFDNNHNLIAYQILHLGIDLDITKVDIPSINIPAGNTLNTIISIANNGALNAGVSLLGVYLSIDAVYDNTDIALQTSNTSAINSGNTIAVNNTSTIPANTTIGNYFLIFVTDNNNQVSEADEANNYHTLQIQVDAPLPVELLYFTGEETENGNLLNWETETEINNKGFHVQRSKNGKDWETIGFVDGKGTSLEVHQYEFLDKTFTSGLNYYRLEQVDFDGTIDYSEIIDLKNEHGKGLVISLRPNPTTTNGFVNLKIDGETIGQVNYQIIGVNSQILKSGNINHDGTSTKHQIKTPEIVGTYILRLIDNEGNTLENIQFIVN